MELDENSRRVVALYANILKDLGEINSLTKCPLASLLTGIIIQCSIYQEDIKRIANFAIGEIQARQRLN